MARRVLRIVATSAGLPQPLEGRDGRRVHSGIVKTPVEVPYLKLTATNLEGDRQADLSAHGGPDKAIYMYPAEHWPFWEEHGVATRAGGFGENVTTTGLVERDVRLGDRFVWGDATLEVTQPRSPCYKLAMHLGRPDVAALMTRSGRTGWYLRVLTPGKVPTCGEIIPLDTQGDARTEPTVEDTFAGSFARHLDPAAAQEILSSTALAQQWRDGLAARLERSETRRRKSDQ